MTATGDMLPRTLDLSLRINGRLHSVGVEPWVTLLDLLRERLGLHGSKKGCDHGQCGACTVLVDGRRVNACLQLAATLDGKEVTTVEGLAGPDGALHPVQAAFVRHDAFQCGYCTSGQVMSAVALIEEGRPLDEESIRGWMSGNLCRCGAYPNIAAAVQDAARAMGREPGTAREQAA